jgi:hypothetical protein
MISISVIAILYIAFDSQRLSSAQASASASAHFDFFINAAQHFTHFSEFRDFSPDFTF